MLLKQWEEEVIELDKFDKHMGKPETIILKNIDGEEDTFTLYPLPLEHIGKIFRLNKQFMKLGTKKKLSKPEDVTDEELQEYMKLFDDDTINLIQEVVMKTLELSYPDVDKVKLSKFASVHLMELFNVVIGLNAIGKISDDQMRKYGDAVNKK